MLYKNLITARDYVVLFHYNMIHFMNSKLNSKYYERFVYQLSQTKRFDLILKLSLFDCQNSVIMIL